MSVEPTSPTSPIPRNHTLDTVSIRCLLEQDLPEIPHELVYEADIRLLAIISAALLDGQEAIDQRDRDHG